MSNLPVKKHGASALQGIYLLIAFLVVLCVAGCVISPRRLPGDVVPGSSGGGGTGSPTPTPTPGGGGGGTAPAGKIYVASPNNSILRFDNAFTASGNIGPAATITGALTTLAKPEYIFLDAAADRLYVANNTDADILVFEAVSTKTGNVAPTRTISSANLSIPTDVQVDTTKDLLYVADGPDIFVFSSASTINGASTPLHDMILTFSPKAIFVDAGNDRLYAADQTNSSISVFDNASTLDGAQAPPRTVTGAQTGLGKPSGVQVDSSGRLVVSNVQPASITIYNGAATANGNIAPSATISGSGTLFSVLGQMVIRNGQLYVADFLAPAVDVYSNIATETGNISPDRRIFGPGTGLAAAPPNGIAVDTTR